MCVRVVRERSVCVCERVNGMLDAPCCAGHESDNAPSICAEEGADSSRHCTLARLVRQALTDHSISPQLR